MKIRLATNQDQAGIVALINEVLGEYDDAICLEGSEADLNDLQSNFFDVGGAFWVIEDSSIDHDRSIVGTHALLPLQDRPEVCVFKRLYLAKGLRGGNWGHQLMQTNIDWAKEHKLKRVEFWSDARFSRAHRFFEKFGFQTTGERRTMTDSHENYDELFFFLNF